MILKENAQKYDKLRSEYPVFTYRSYSYELVRDAIIVRFNYQVGDEIAFSPEVKIKLDAEFTAFFDHHSLTDLDTLFFNIGLVELVSYWKATCSPLVAIECGFLNQKAVDFWKKLYFNGLGEFFYCNGISTDENRFLDFHIVSTTSKPMISIPLSDKYIVPIGGGKDSVVTLELLNKSFDVKPMIINPRGATVSTANEAGFKNNFFEIERKIDPTLLRLNEAGFLNGHTPFSAMLAFYTVLVALLSGRKNIALSNEGSANEATVVGTNINHQYSKSFDFEKDIRGYLRAFVHKDVNYYSFLRPLSELQIAYLFAKNKQYLSIFKSCNVGSKTDSWCCSCPKCLFTFIILSPFVDKNLLTKVYGKALFSQKELLPILRQLIGDTPEKPFECVGTIDEVCLALVWTLPFYEGELPSLLAYFVETPQYKKYKEISLLQTLAQWNPEHCLSVKEEQLLKNELEKNKQ